MSPDPNIPASAPLEPNLVPNPQTCRMALRVSPEALDMVIVSRVNDNALIWRRLPMPDSADSDGAISVRSLEEVVYDNRLLLSDFAAVDVLIDTPRFMAIPNETAADTGKVEEIFGSLYPDDEQDVIVSRATDDAAIAFSADPALTAFLRRTFGAGVRISHVIAPLVRFFAIKTRLGNNGKLHLHMDGRRATLIAFGREGLLMANTFRVNAAEDAVFYTLTAAHHLGFDNATDRVIVSGDSDLRDSVLPLLRRSLSYVMPLIFPSDIFKLGRDALRAPFELIALPLID